MLTAEEYTEKQKPLRDTELIPWLGFHEFRMLPYLTVEGAWALVAKAA